MRALLRAVRDAIADILARLAGRPGRVCTRCRRWRRAAAFRANAKLIVGLDSWCRACHAAVNREWRSRVREVHEKSCPECGAGFIGRGRTIYCGGRCQRRVQRRRARERDRMSRAPRSAPIPAAPRSR